jgi:hypothetical protein
MMCGTSFYEFLTEQYVTLARMDRNSFINDPVLLWETTDGLRCTVRRCPSGPPFEITIHRDAEIVRQMTFEHDEDASAFAVAAMHEGNRCNATPHA